jgi:BirA family biotin operon repressor/biotin-[acetyl-CoA-carboxylase] ligase
VWRLANAGAPEGLVVFAEEQTRARGQRGNTWESAAGKGLWFSILLRPRIAPRDSARLTTWAANTIAGVVEQTVPQQATVKPPNDVYVENRKIAGVLVEMRAQTGAPHLAIVGIGLNVNQQPRDFPLDLRERAVSLAMLRGRPVERHPLAVKLLQKLNLTYQETFASLDSQSR